MLLTKIIEQILKGPLNQLRLTWDIYPFEFSSFNYQTEIAQGQGDGPNHLANLQYAICFRIENGFCGIKYSQVSADTFSFTISGDSSIAMIDLNNGMEFQILLQNMPKLLQICNLNVVHSGTLGFTRLQFYYINLGSFKIA